MESETLMPAVLTTENIPDNFRTMVRTAEKLGKREHLTIVDIGARDCKETFLFDKFFPNSKIYAFECNPATLPICRETTAGHLNLTLIEKAVTDVDGRSRFIK
jgi:hypothetical protein